MLCWEVLELQRAVFWGAVGMRGAATTLLERLKEVTQPGHAAGQEAEHLRGQGSWRGQECLLEVSIPGRGCKDAWYEFGSCQNQLIGLLQKTLSLNAAETKAEGERVGSQQHWWKMRDQASHGRHPLAGTGSALLQWPISTLPEPCRRALAEGCA